MPKAPSPWNRECRRNVDTDTPADFGTDIPTIALSKQEPHDGNLARSGDESKAPSTAVGLALAVGVGAVISALVIAVIAALSKSGAGT